MKNLDIYKVNCDDTNESSLAYTISLVDDPANMSLFVAMAKEKKEIIKLSEEKREITGVVLIPDQKIYRYNEQKGEFFITFGAEEIKKLSKKFYKNNFQGNSNINHIENKPVNGITYFQSWIVEDPECDKSKIYGFDVPVGTWMVTAYVEDDEAWEMAKTGLVKGFSIEAFLDIEKIEMSINKNNKLNKKEKMSLLKRLITMFSSDEDIKLKAIKSDLGPLTVDSLELGAMVYQDVDGEMVPLVNSVFQFEGMAYITDADGKISDISEVVAEVPSEDVVMEEVPVEEDVKKEEEMEEIPVEEVVANEIVEDAIEVIAEVPVEAEINYEEVIKNITKQLELVIEENTQLKSKVEELSKQPAATKLGIQTKNNEKESYWETLSRITKQ